MLIAGRRTISGKNERIGTRKVNLTLAFNAQSVHMLGIRHVPWRITMTERDKFVARFERKRENGLVDTKFFVNHHDGLTVDGFFSAVNRLEEAVDAGFCRRHQKFNETFAQRDFSARLK